jgi:hypothetical protein
MIRSVRWAVLVLVLSFTCGRAADEAKPGPAKPNEVLALYHDGTKLRLIFLQEELEVVTKYGKLTVPTRDIRRIDFGFRMSDETARKLDEAMKHLASDNFPLREAAQKDLLALGRLAYPTLVKASKGNDLETTRRVEDILKAIRTKVPSEQLRSRTDDLIYTTTFTIAGRLDVQTIKAKTEHFGEVGLKVMDLRSLHSAVGVSETKLSIDAAAYGSNNIQWMDTGVTVQADTPLIITASGEVDLYGNQGGGAISGPDGNRQYSRGGQFAPGALVARIGEEGGEVVVVGRKLEKTPTVEGKLYLRIVAVPGSNGATGNYSVQISSGHN